MNDSSASLKASDSDLALQALSDDRAAYGCYTCTVVVHDRDEVKAEEKLKAAEAVINGLGFTCIRETVNAVEAWLGSIPGHVYANVRRPLISTMNLTHMLPVSAIWPGEEYNSHLEGPPLFHAVSSGNTPFRFCTHEGDVGHTIVAGPTGSGKSVLLSLMALQFLRYPEAQVYFFDKGASALAAAAGVKGDFYNLAAQDSDLAFQPLAYIDEEAELTWANEWILDILTLEQVEITPDLKQRLWTALNSLAGASERQRTITGLTAMMQDHTLRQALEPYSIQGPHGRLLDADQETLRRANWQCFEMEALMNIPRLIVPVLTFLFHRLEGRFNTAAPAILILDEAWLFLDNSAFCKRIREWLKVLRKKNVSVVFATQSLADIQDSSIFHAIVESCPTRIFLPNPRAKEDSTAALYSRFGLNQRQIEILSQAVPKRDYYVSSPKGNRLFRLGLGPLALAFCTASQEEKKFILEQEGKDGFLEKYLKYKGLDISQISSVYPN